MFHPSGVSEIIVEYNVIETKKNKVSNPVVSCTVELDRSLFGWFESERSETATAKDD